VIDSQKHDMDEVVGNAEDEESLKAARIGEARFCIVALGSDAVNIFATLMARNLNPEIRILARANEASSVDKLYRAGADYVALLPRIGGQTIGRIVLSDTITVLVDLPDNEMIALKRAEKKNQRTVGDLVRHSGVRVLGIEAPGRVIVAPSDSEDLHDGDTVIVAGDTERLKKFIRIF